jgi:hypothetical protein
VKVFLFRSVPSIMPLLWLIETLLTLFPETCVRKVEYEMDSGVGDVLREEVAMSKTNAPMISSQISHIAYFDRGEAPGC